MYHFCRQAVAMGVIRIAKEDSETNLADLFSKLLPRSVRERLLNMFTYWLLSTYNFPWGMVFIAVIQVPVCRKALTIKIIVEIVVKWGRVSNTKSKIPLRYPRLRGDQVNMAMKSYYVIKMKWWTISYEVINFARYARMIYTYVRQTEYQVEYWIWSMVSVASLWSIFHYGSRCSYVRY